MKQLIAYAKKAFVAGALACVAVVLSWNVPAWIDGTEDFQWRSVAAGLVAAFITGVATFHTTNKIPEA